MKRKRFIYFTIIVVISFILTSTIALSNNVRITNSTRTGAARDMITFDLSWDNSWNVAGIPANHDAVWVIVKFKPCGGSVWDHARLSTTMTDHSFASGVTYAKPITTVDRNGDAGAFNNGVMVRRSDIGIGNIANKTISLKIVGSALGATLDAGTEYDIKVIGIEMVQVLSGQFQAGDGVSTYPVFNTAVGSGTPMSIASEAAISINSTEGWPLIALPAKYPKGYSEFYCMKYEVTHGQYCDFLNTISGAAAVARYYNTSSSMHNLLYSSVYYSDNGDRALNFMSVEDLFSYLDWAALRPMTDLEYEKSCRGPIGGVQDYAFGATSFVEALNVTGANAGVEVCTDVNANLHCAATNSNIIGGAFGAGNSGPLGAGVFARDATTSRVATGASYWGAMELSGNVREATISYRTTSGATPSSYTGVWGDGILAATGLYNTTLWPLTGVYFGLRGGGWSDASTACRVSDRSYYSNSDFLSRDYAQGGRGVR